MLCHAPALAAAVLAPPAWSWAPVFASRGKTDATFHVLEARVRPERIEIREHFETLVASGTLRIQPLEPRECFILPAQVSKQPGNLRRVLVSLPWQRSYFVQHSLRVLAHPGLCVGHSKENHQAQIAGVRHMRREHCIWRRGHSRLELSNRLRILLPCQ